MKKEKKRIHDKIFIISVGTSVEYKSLITIRLIFLQATEEIDLSTPMKKKERKKNFPSSTLCDIFRSLDQCLSIAGVNLLIRGLSRG